MTTKQSATNLIPAKSKAPISKLSNDTSTLSDRK